MIRDPASYNAGVRDAIDLLRRSQRAWAGSGLHATRKDFATAALDQLAGEIAKLVIAPPGAGPVAAAAPRPRAPAPAGEGVQP